MTLAIGDAVIVGEPNHPQSEHNHGFAGTIINIYEDDFVTVRDMDDDYFLVHIDDIESLDI